MTLSKIDEKVYESGFHYVWRQALVWLGIIKSPGFTG